MNCATFEISLADYIDGTLGQSERAAMDEHASACSACRELLTDAMGAVALLRRADEIEPPAELVTRIAFQVPQGRIRQPFERQGLVSKILNRWLQPLLQPRLAMGMAMTILSFAMLERCTGIHIQRIQPADLNPIRIWGSLEDKTMRTKDRAVKYYENLRWVYEIETRLKALQDQPDEGSSDASRARNSADRLSERATKGASAPKQGNQR